jgi:hypothetical protein
LGGEGVEVAEAVAPALDKPDLGVDALQPGVRQPELDGRDDRVEVLLDPAYEVGECRDAAALDACTPPLQIGPRLGRLDNAVEIA